MTQTRSRFGTNHLETYGHFVKNVSSLLVHTLNTNAQRAQETLLLDEQVSQVLVLVKCFDDAVGVYEQHPGFDAPRVHARGFE